MAELPIPPRAVQSNIEAIVRLEEEHEHGRTFLDRFPEAVGSFAGTIWFIGLQLAFVAFWVAANSGAVPGFPAFDPFPFPLLAGILSLEGVLLTAFVLIRQNWMNRKAEQRNHLDLQINLLSEQEITKIIQVLEHISRRLGIEGEAVDEETRELGEATAVEGLARRLRDTIEAEGKI